MPRYKHKLGIVIPYYNAKPYTDKLLDVLDKQITDAVQVVIVDDGSKEEYKTDYKWAKVIRKENGGASSARNVGLDNIKAQYVTFIDSDDMVPEYYVEKILEKIETEKFDYCYMSWKSVGQWNYQKVIKSVDDKYDQWNVCVWCRVYKWSLVKDIRFNEKKLIAEDAEYIREAEKYCKKKSFIKDYMYYYNSSVPNSLTKEFNDGHLNTKRLVYHYPKVTKDMDYLIEEVKEAYKDSEVIILTNLNEIPELEEYAMVMKPVTIKGTEFKGVPTPLFSYVPSATKYQVVIWTEKTFAIGGIETFIYNFCREFHDKYDIMVLYNSMDAKQIQRLEEYVYVKRNHPSDKIVCDTLMINRITDKIPKNIKYNQTVQMIHCCKLKKEWSAPTSRDHIVAVSNVVRDTYDELKDKDVKIINNIVKKSDHRKALRLVSATRLTFEKGGDRISKLAKLFKQYNIPFIWTIFTDRPMSQKIDGIVYMDPNLDIADYMLASDYVVQLSDSEGFGYSIVEALQLGIPVLTTPIEVLDELGFKDKEHGYIIPFDLDGFDPTELYENRPSFEYNYSNEKIRKQWIEILGDTTPTGIYKKKKDQVVTAVILKPYKDLELKRRVAAGERIEVNLLRAEQLRALNLCRIEE